MSRGEFCLWFGWLVCSCFLFFYVCGICVWERENRIVVAIEIVH